MRGHWQPKGSGSLHEDHTERLGMQLSGQKLPRHEVLYLEGQQKVRQEKRKRKDLEAEQTASLNAGAAPIRKQDPDAKSTERTKLLYQVPGLPAPTPCSIPWLHLSVCV